MNLHELFEKFETEFLAGHEKIKTGLDLELFVTNPAAPILIAAWVYVALQIYFIPIHIIFINNLAPCKRGIFFG